MHERTSDLLHRLTRDARAIQGHELHARASFRLESPIIKVPENKRNT
jgi:hypothetical protein